MMGIRELVLVPAAAAVLTACGGQAVQPVQTIDEVPSAVRAIAEEPVRWEMSLDLDFDLDEIAAAIDTVDLLAGDGGEGERDLIEAVRRAREVVDTIRRVSVSGAMDAEGGSLLALNVDGEPVAETAVSEHGWSSWSTMTGPWQMLEEGPIPVEMYLRVDPDRLGAFVVDVDDGTSQQDVDAFLARLFDNPVGTLANDPDASLDDLVAHLQQLPAEAREQAGIDDPQQVADEIGAVLDAVLAGEWVGLVGDYDMAGALEAAGIDPDELRRQFEEAGMEQPEPFDPDAFVELGEQAIEYRDLQVGDDGRATVVADLDVAAAVTGFLDLMAEYDTTGMFSAMIDQLHLEPGTMSELEGVAELTLVGDDLVEVRTDLLQLATVIADVNPEVTDAEVAELRDTLTGLDTTRMWLTIRYHDHGAVDPILDPIDATTLDVGLLTGLATASMAEAAPPQP